ncbi:MAG: low molecular weight phosphatase family protein [Candidatus Sigynarchaeota archaeon]
MPDPSRKDAFEALARALKDKEEVRVLFVCGANICRSPYMEMKFEHEMDAKPCPKKKVIASSGGFMTSPRIHDFTAKRLLETGVSAARVDKFSPRSMRKHKDELEAVDFIISPTREIIEMLVPRRYRDKTFLLSEAANGTIDDVEDPVLIPEYDKYVAVLDRIDTYIPLLVQQLRRAWNCP